jgi:hypothetical protein
MRASAFALAVVAGACDPRHAPFDPATAPRAHIDRFSDAAGTIFRRSERTDLPGPDEPIDFDRGPFLVRGLGPDGRVAEYYNFDVRPQLPAFIRFLVRDGDAVPVAQGVIVNALPGDPRYSDLWQVVLVFVPHDYVPNTITSLDQIFDGAYREVHTGALINCPVVPEGSTAAKRLGGTADLRQGWYRDQVIFYFTFSERQIVTTAGGSVPLADLFVTFNVNADRRSGYVKEMGTAQTHNVLAVLPEDPAYSPLWTVRVYDNAAFDEVRDLAAARAAPVIDDSLFVINAPIVSEE